MNPVGWHLTILETLQIKGYNAFSFEFKAIRLTKLVVVTKNNDLVSRHDITNFIYYTNDYGLLNKLGKR